MSTAKKNNALAELDAKRDAIAAAEARVAQIEADKVKAERELDQATAALDAYYRAVGAGECEPDQAEERKLHKATGEAQAHMTTRLIDNPREGIGAGRVEKGDSRFDGLLRGAREAVQARRDEYERFLSVRWNDLEVELAEHAADVQQRHKDLWTRALEAEREWKAARKRWDPLVRSGAFTWADFPESPLTDGLDALPVPRQLVGDGDAPLPRPDGPRPKRRKQTERKPAPAPQRPRRTRKRAA